jgi:protein-disulfide isomerase
MELRDIRSNPEFLRELVEELKSKATPTVVIGEKVLSGFDPGEYETALAALKN